MNKGVHISEATKALGVTPHYLRILEYKGRVPTAKRDFNSRVYSEFDIALLKALGVGTYPRKLKRAEDVLEGLHE